MYNKKYIMDKKCSICLSKNPNYTTKCNHLFHKKCLKKWLKKKST